MRFGMPGRVLLGVGVVLVAVPVIALSASGSEVVEVRPMQIPAQATVAQPTRQDIKQIKVERVRVTPEPVERVKVVVQEQEQEQEPWRSARKVDGRDVVAPRLTRMEHPKYTPDAMRAKIQGMVTVEAIVSAEGDVVAVRVIKSLDKELGLDEEAMKVSRLWKFLPGTYQGQPVPVRVTFDLEFRLH